MARTVLCPRTALGSQGETEVETSGASFGAKLLPAHFLNAILVTAEALQTEPCPRGGPKHGGGGACARVRAHIHTHTRTHVRAKAGDGVLHGGGRHAESGCDPQRSSAQAAGCRCRPRGAGVQQNISKRVWARFRSVRQSLRPTLPADPSFTRVSSRAALVSATYVIRPRRARANVLPARARPPFPLSGPRFGPGARDLLLEG